MPSDNKTNDNVNKTLQKVAKGSTIVFIGLILSLIPAFIGRVLIVRRWTEVDYGVFSLAFSILYICAVVGTLGLRQGLPRNIAYTIGRKDYNKIPDFISSSIWYSLIVSSLFGLVLFLLSEQISLKIFSEPALIEPLRIFSFGIPFFSLIFIIASAFRGFNEIKPTIYFQQILLNVLFPIFLVVIISLELAFINVFYALIFSIVITFITLFIYSIKKISDKQIFSLKTLKKSSSKELISFSLPLLGAAILSLVIAWTDTMMLGGLKNVFYVGLYNAALPLAQLITFPLTALFLVHMPIVSRLFAQNKSEEIKRNYLILTKWLWYVTFPFFLLLVLYPEQILSLLFGSNYIVSANALRILSFGFIIINFFGPSGHTLIAMGKSRFILYASLTAAMLNVGLNAVLIIKYDILGAAIASLCALATFSLIRSWKLYSISGVTPLSKNLLKPTIFSLLIIIPIYLISQEFIDLNWWILPILFVALYVIFFFVVLVSRSVDQEDIALLQTVEEKIGIKLKFLKKLISKFQ